MAKEGAIYRIGSAGVLQESTAKQPVAMHVGDGFASQLAMQIGIQHAPIIPHPVAIAIICHDILEFTIRVNKPAMISRCLNLESAGHLNRSP